MTATLILALHLFSRPALAQVGPVAVPRTTGPVGTGEVAAVASTMIVHLPLGGTAYLGGGGARASARPHDGVSVAAVGRIWTPIQSADFWGDHSPWLFGGALDLGRDLGVARLGVWSAAGMADLWGYDDSGPRFGVGVGPSLAFELADSPIMMDLHVTLLHCSDELFSGGSFKLQCRRSQDGSSTWEWVQTTLVTTEVGVDFPVGDRQWMRAGISASSPFFAWMFPGERFDLVFRATGLGITFPILETQVTWHPERPD